MSRITCLDAAGNSIQQLYQWDLDVTLVMHDVDQRIIDSNVAVHFGNKSTEYAYVVSPTVDGTTISADIPNILLQRAETISAYLYTRDSSGEKRTRSNVQIPVAARPKPEDYPLLVDDGIVHIMQGDEYPLALTVLDNAGNIITDETCEVLEVMIGPVLKKYPEDISYDSEHFCFSVPLYQEDTFKLSPGTQTAQARVKGGGGVRGWHECGKVEVKESKSKAVI